MADRPSWRSLSAWQQSPWQWARARATKVRGSGWGWAATILYEAGTGVGLLANEVAAEHAALWIAGPLLALVAFFLVAIVIGFSPRVTDARTHIEQQAGVIAALEDRSARLEVAEADEEQPHGWSDAWRVRVWVRNVGVTGRFIARLRRPVKGIDDDDYGELPLQWRLYRDEEREIPGGGGEELLHIAYTKDAGFKFLGPSNFVEHGFYNPVNRADSNPVVGDIEIFEMGTPRSHRFTFEITLDHDHRPKLRLI